MSLLVSSGHPAQAGVQVALVELLVDVGASVQPLGEGTWTSPLRTALTFGYLDAARALVRRGATVTSVAEAAGLGDRAAVVARLADATAEDRHRALALAAALGHVEVVGTLLDAGEDPDRYNPPNGHAHSTPLHQAVAAGHLQRGAVAGGTRRTPRPARHAVRRHPAWLGRVPRAVGHRRPAASPRRGPVAVGVWTAARSGRIQLLRAFGGSGTSTSAFRRAPLLSVSQPLDCAVWTVCPGSARISPFGVPWSKRMSTGGHGRRRGGSRRRTRGRP